MSKRERRLVPITAAVWTTMRKQHRRLEQLVDAATESVAKKANYSAHDRAIISERRSPR